MFLQLNLLKILLYIAPFRFPSREEVLNYVIRVTKNQLKKQPRTLIVVGAYSIGKEWVYLAISKEMGVRQKYFFVCRIYIFSEYYS